MLYMAIKKISFIEREKVMKSMKKIAVLLLALVMLLGLSSAVSAQTGTGSIEVGNVQAGKAVRIYKIFDLSYTGTEPDQKVSYTISSDWKDFFTAPGKGSAYINETNVEGLLTPINVDGKTKYINITGGEGGNVAAFSKAAMDYAMKKPLKADKEKLASTGTDTVNFTGLDLGYYLIYSVGASEVSDSTASICSLTSTVPNGTVNIKATYPVITKKDDKASADVGEKVTYTITGKVPDTTGFTDYTYMITDTMSEGLTFNRDVKVTTDSGVLIKDTDYKVAYDVGNNANKFTVTIYVKNRQDKVGEKIKVTYSATVNEKAIAKIENNHATLTYSNDPTNDKLTETLPEEEKVYSARIVIDKYEKGNENTKLPGAEFVLYKEDAKEIKYYYYNENSKKVEWYSLKAGETLEDVLAAAGQTKITKVTTDNNGAASFDGLADGEYFLKETKAPKGYNLLSEPKKIAISNQEETVTETALTVTAKVANASGSPLPGAGGSGTTVFYIVGSILLVGAALTLVIRKR